MRRYINEPVSSKMHKFEYAPFQDLDQSAHLRRQIWVFDGHSMDSQGSSVSSGGNLRLWSDCVEAQTNLNGRCLHMLTCT